MQEWHAPLIGYEEGYSTRATWTPNMAKKKLWTETMQVLKLTKKGMKMKLMQWSKNEAYKHDSQTYFKSGKHGIIAYM